MNYFRMAGLFHLWDEANVNMLSVKLYAQNIQIALVCVILVFNYSSFGQDLNETCESSDSSDGIDGYCVDVRSCEKAVRSIIANRTHNFKRCRFEKSREIICCPFDVTPTRNPIGNEDLAVTPTNSELDTSRSPQKNSSQNVNVEMNNTIPHKKLSPYNRPLRISEQVCETYENNSIGLLRTSIIGGSKAEESEFPHMAAIKLNYTSLKTVCGGSLISKRHILTAAHCLMDGEGNTPVAVQLGSLSASDVSNEEVTTYLIETNIVHPLYRKRSKYNDIGIIKLRRDVIMMNSRSYIYPACLNTDNSYPSPGDKLVISGWGLTEEDKPSDLLMKATVSFISTQNCAKVYNTKRGLLKGLIDGQMCAVGNGTDTCNGDSGGPLQSPLPSNSGVYRIVGLTSFGYVCGSDRPGVYTRISHYIDWIESVVWPDKVL